MGRSKKLAGEKKVSIKKMTQEIDVRKYLGEVYEDDKSSKKRNEYKQAFADITRDFIENRTLSGEDINGTKFKKYTKKYAIEKGVNRNDVNLYEKGKLLNGIARRKTKETVNTMILQMKAGLETKKGFNHDTGDAKGNPKREFFGITEKDAREIALEVQKTVKPSAVITMQDLRNEINGEG